MRDALVVTQVALTAVLLVVAGLLLRSLGASQGADVGFDPRGLAAISLDAAMVRYNDERSAEFWRQALTRVRALPGVTSAGLITPTLPFTFNFSQQEMRVDSRTYAEGKRAEIIENAAVSPAYLPTLGVQLVDGRGFEESDISGSPDVVVINHTMAQRFWPNQSAVGHTVQTVNPTRSRTYRVIGVIADHKRHGVLESPEPFAYFADAQRLTKFKSIIARTDGSADTLLAAMRRELFAIEPGLVFMTSSTMEQNLGMSLMPARVGAILATAFGGLGTLLAGIGLYGVIAFSVARRTREIGVRMALGANPGAVLSMVMRQGFAIVAIGMIAGAVLAGIAASALRVLLYGITPYDPIAWGLALSAMLVAAALANFVPARRAMRVDPIAALRTE
jgi:predicted permease